MPSHRFRTKWMIQGEPEASCRTWLQVGRTVGERTAKKHANLGMDRWVGPIPKFDVHPGFKCREPLIDYQRPARQP